MTLSQGAAAREWLAAREAELLPVSYEKHVAARDAAKKVEEIDGRAASIKAQLVQEGASDESTIDPQASNIAAVLAAAGVELLPQRSVRH